MIPRPSDVWTIHSRKRSTGTVFPDSYTNLDHACEAFDDTDWLEFEFLGAAHLELDHPAAAGTSSDFDIQAATDQWRRDRAMERRHVRQEMAGVYAGVAAE